MLDADIRSTRRLWITFARRGNCDNLESRFEIQGGWLHETTDSDVQNDMDHTDRFNSVLSRTDFCSVCFNSVPRIGNSFSQLPRNCFVQPRSLNLIISSSFWSQLEKDVSCKTFIFGLGYYRSYSKKILRQSAAPC